MARHRRHRHAAPRNWASPRNRPPDDGRLEGWRHIVRTPTFALGVAVVALAMLAYGASQTYLRFSGSGPGSACPPAGCAAPTAPSGTPTANAPAVRITYQTLASTQPGFTAQLTITNTSEREITTWQLTFGYKHSQITTVTGAQWTPSSGQHVATIGQGPQPGPVGAHQSVRFSYTATGPAHVPVTCHFNGASCKIK